MYEALSYWNVCQLIAAADSLLELDSALADEEEAASQVLTLLALLVQKVRRFAA